MNDPYGDPGDAPRVIVLRAGSARLLAVGLASVALAACSATKTTPDDDLAAPVNDGPITGGGVPPSTLCLPPDHSGRSTFALNRLTNSGDADAVIDRVTVNGLHGLTLIETAVVPMRPGDNGISAVPGYPPPMKYVQRYHFRWEARQSVPGAVLPAGSQASAALVLELSDEGTPGSMRSYTVDYHVEQDRYRLTTNTKFVVPPVGGNCDDMDSD